MQVEPFNQVPMSGSVPERWFDAVGFCSWFRFITDDYEEWAGVFGNGIVPMNGKAVLYGDGRTAFVIAAGQGYVVDGKTSELYHKTECNYLADVISVPRRDFVVACHFTDLLAYTRTGPLWQSRRIALDEIRFQSATEHSVVGRALHVEGWQTFVLEFDGWTIRWPDGPTPGWPLGD